MTKRKRQPPEDPQEEAQTTVDMPQPRFFDIPHDAPLEDLNEYTGAPRKRGSSHVIYNPAFAQAAKQLCKMGATDMNLADAFGVRQDTIDSWRIKHKEFRVAMRVGKKVADDAVERSLFQRAVGYEIEDVKVFMPANADVPVVVPIRVRIPAEPKCIAMWLHNRRPDKWREELKVQTAVTVVVKQYTLSQTEAAGAATVDVVGQPQLSGPEPSDRQGD